MKKQKVILTPQQIYKKNKRNSKVFSVLAPCAFYVFMVVAIIFIILTLANSVGNIIEIFNLLDKKTHTGDEIAENYRKLVEKWGEWEVLGGDGSLFKVTFIDLRKAMFGGLMITYFILACISFLLAILLGKLIFPRISKMLLNSNEDMVNIATLDTMEEVRELSKKKKESEKKEWF